MKYSKAQRKRITPQLINEVENSIAWARTLQAHINQLVRVGEIEATTGIISRSVSRMNWLPTCLLALTACRFQDLKQIKLEGIIDSVPQTILQRKTGKQRELKNLIISERHKISALTPDAQIMHTSYESLNADIKDHTPTEIAEVLKDHSSGTHIFRHLRASFYSAQGWSVDEIKAFFNHESVSATKQYINPVLCVLFKS